jgi:hypothetical protein
MLLTLGAGAAVYWLALERPSLIVPPDSKATTEVSVSSGRVLLRGTLGDRLELTQGDRGVMRVAQAPEVSRVEPPGIEPVPSVTPTIVEEPVVVQEPTVLPDVGEAVIPSATETPIAAPDIPPSGSFSLGRTAALYGVASQAGRPIAGAGVLALGEGIERKKTEPVRTGQAGEYRIEGLLPGTYRVLLLEENGMRTVRAKDLVLGSEAEHRLDFDYPKEGSVSGTVSESGTGRPIRGARLSLSWKPGEELFGEVGPDAWVPLPLAKVTGLDGSYRLERLIPGTYRIEVNHGGHQPAIRDVRVEEGARVEDCEIHLSR